MSTTSPKLFCPDCGTNLTELAVANVLNNQWCFTCPDCSSHWLRYYRHVENLRVSECEIPHEGQPEAHPEQTYQGRPREKIDTSS